MQIYFSTEMNFTLSSQKSQTGPLNIFSISFLHVKLRPKPITVTLDFWYILDDLKFTVTLK